MDGSVGPVRRFRVEVAQAILDGIANRLALSRVGYAPDSVDRWQHGTSADYLADLLDYWRRDFDWRAMEQRLNRFPQFKVQVEDIDIHFYHVRGSGSARRAILLTHGWPGSVMEFLDCIERITCPERFGGRAEDGFDVVVPSLPGYGFSSRPAAPIGPRRIAALWRRLMVEALGYPRFFAQGGDWGAAVTSWLGSDHADIVAGIHLNLVLGVLAQDHSPEATAWRQRVDAVRAAEGGYSHEQGTMPQTIGLALSDSPLAFACWVLEKFQRWGDTGGTIESRFSKDVLIGNIMTYLVNDAVTSAIWVYYGAAQEPARYATRIDVPTAVALFPAEPFPIPPRPAAERLMNVQRWSVMPRGGHFAAMEEPALFSDDVCSFFNALPEMR